jgi:hypothetical protein
LLEGFDGDAHDQATGGHLDEMVVRIAGKRMLPVARRR